MKLISEDVQDIEVEEFCDELLLIQGGDRIVLSREQLAQLVAAQQNVQSDEANCSIQYHLMLAAKGDTVCGICHQPLRR